VVAEGLTVTPTPLLAVRLPGVITPVPLAKTPVRVALDPSGTEVGFPLKLLIEGGGGVPVLADPLPQPVKPAKPRLRAMASGVRTRTRFIGYPVSRSGEILTRTQPSQRSIRQLIDVRRTWPGHCHS
jgi:hypothetical protein